MDIKLNDQQFAEVIGKQILESITPEARDKLITDAIVALNKRPDHGYGRTADSPLQQAFNIAVTGAVHELARELVEQSPIREHIEKAAQAFITIFPAAWEDERLQTEVMATIVRWARENGARD